MSRIFRVSLNFDAGILWSGSELGRSRLILLCFRRRTGGIGGLAISLLSFILRNRFL